MTLVEIGPRFVLTPIRIFEGAFNGATVYSNPGKASLRITIIEKDSEYFVEFISPAAVRSLIRREKGGKYNYRKDAQEGQERRKEMRRLGEDELAVSNVFV
jgi:ribosome biogenesis protein BRX1